MPAGVTLADDQSRRQRMVSLIVNRLLHRVLKDMPCDVADHWLQGEGPDHLEAALRAALIPRSAYLQVPQPYSSPPDQRGAVFQAVA